MSAYNCSRRSGAAGSRVLPRDTSLASNIVPAPAWSRVRLFMTHNLPHPPPNSGGGCRRETFYRISIWSMFARSCPVDSKRTVFVELLLRLTVTFWVFHVVQAPVGLNVMFEAEPFTSRRPVREIGRASCRERASG